MCEFYSGLSPPRTFSQEKTKGLHVCRSVMPTMLLQDSGLSDVLASKARITWRSKSQGFFFNLMQQILNEWV